MTMLKKIQIIALSGAALLAFTTSSAQALSLDEALALAYQKNPQIKAERANVRAVDESMPQALSGWMPDVAIRYSKGHQTETLGGQEDSNAPDSRSLTYNQSLFSGGSSYYSVKAAKQRVQAAREQLRRVEQQIFTQAVTAYVDIVRTQRILDLSINNERVLAEQVDATDEKFKLGETTRTDVAQAESRLARAESDRIQAQGNLIAARSEFKRVFITDAPDNLTMPVINFTLPKNFDEAMERTIADAPNLKIAEHNHRALEQDVRVARSSLLPTIDVTGRIQRDDHLGSLRGYNSIESESITLNVTVPLYQTGSEYSRIRQVKEQMKNAFYDLEQAQNAATDTTTKAWKDLQTTQANIKASQTEVSAADLALEGVREEQEVGSRTVLDVLDQEQELFVARVGLVTAQRNYTLACYNLLAAMGELTANDLGLDVELYDPRDNYNDVKYQFIGY